MKRLKMASIVFVLIFVTSPTFSAWAQSFISVTSGERLSGQWRALCTTDHDPVRIGAADDEVVVEISGLCNNEGSFVGLDKVVLPSMSALSWEEGVAALKLGIRSFSPMSRPGPVQVMIEAQTTNSTDWESYGLSKAYDLNPNDVSFQSIMVPFVFDLSRLRLRVAPIGEINGRWGIEIDRVQLGVFEPNDVEVTQGTVPDNVYGSLFYPCGLPLHVEASQDGVVEVMFDQLFDAECSKMTSEDVASVVYNEGVAALKMSVRTKGGTEINRSDFRVDIAGQTSDGGNWIPLKVLDGPARGENRILGFNIGMPPTLTKNFGRLRLRVSSTLDDPWGMGIHDLCFCERSEIGSR